MEASKKLLGAKLTSTLGIIARLKGKPRGKATHDALKENASKIKAMKVSVDKMCSNKDIDVDGVKNTSVAVAELLDEAAKLASEAKPHIE